MIRAAILALLLALGFAPEAAANPLDAFGFGARGIAMGNAHTAAAADTSANYYNPGALVAPRGEGTGYAEGGKRSLEIDLGYQLARPTLRLNQRDQGVDETRGLAAGLVAPGTVGPVHFAFGVSLFLPDERLTRVRSLPAAAPRFIYYDNRTQRLLLSTNLAIQILPGLYVGGGLTFMSKTKGDVLLNGRIGFPDAEDSELRLGLDVDLVAVRYPQAGLLWVPSEDLSFGLRDRHRFVLELEQGFVIHGDVGPRDSEPVLADGFLAVTSLSNDLFQPAQLVAGAAYAPAPGWLLALDVAWLRWSGFETPGSRVQLRYDLKNFNDLVKLPTPPPLGPPNFHDVVSPRVGIEKRIGLPPLGIGALALHARAGYAFEPSPVPDQTGETNLADGHKHVVSGGLGLELGSASAAVPGRIGLDTFVAYTQVTARTARKSNPADEIGDWTSDGHLWATGITLRAGF